ncbi:ATP-binding protein [Shimia sp.]|uniref:ATP-binding protein n=1 Tax=Shimia sp. TaxID=1954381 RepID=UPI0032978B90
MLEPRRRWKIGVILASVAGILMVMLVFLSIEVQTNLRRLNTASTDTLQWTFGQVEVEMLELANAIALASNDDTSDLETVRLEFDIAYSRVEFLSTSPIYTRIAKADAFNQSLHDLRQFLNDAIPLMDGPDADLRNALPMLRDRTQELRLDARKLAVVGLGRFVEESDEKRKDVGTTLIRLALLAVLLVAALVALIFYMLIIYRQARDRGTALAQANNRMNTILTTSLDGVIVCDTLGRVLEFNAAAQNIFGLSKAVARMGSMHDLFVADEPLSGSPNSTNTSGTVNIRQLVGRGRVELQARRATGEIFPVEIAVQSAFDSEQELYVAFLRDISKRVADEKELVQARDSALAGEQAKSDFLTVMSHEIRTPLNGLLGTLSLLEDTSLNATQAQFVRNMEVSGKVLTRHVDSVLDLARFEAGKATFTSVLTDLDKVVQDVLDGQYSLAKRSGTKLCWYWVGQPQRWVRLDPTGLEQVLLNLTNNAIKFTPDGEVRIEVEVISDTPVTYVEFRVIDTGLGIPDQDLEKVFQDFVTRDASFGRQTGGTGLGLGISRRIVIAMGGDIGVESTRHEGSVFWFHLPVQPAAAPPSQKTATPTADASNALDILVVEDNDINRDVACEMLHREGHKVTCAPDGIAGVEHANKHEYDVILMDISMPGLDGFQAAGCIRRGDGASRSTPIIAFSANVMPLDLGEIEHAGMNGFLSKPLSRKQLTEALTRIRSGETILNAAPTLDSGVLDETHLLSTRESLGDKRVNALMTRFHDELETLNGSLAEKDLTAGQMPDLAADTHKAAASASVFGASQLRKTLLAIEQAAKTGDLKSAAEQARTLDPVWTETKAALHRFMI